MAAIITDQLRILNAKNFLKEISDPSNSYYTFVGLPNPFDYNQNWDVNPPSPKDSFDQENFAWDNMISLKKIRSEDVKQVVKKIEWVSGIIYDRYRNNIDRDNLANQSSATSLYSSNFYVVTSDFRVYICLENGEDPENPNGKPSLDEPRFTDLEPRSAGNSGDGYIWKYLYSINPSDVIRFDATQYIPVPKNWDSNNDVATIRENAFDGGQLKTIIIKDRGENLSIPNQVYSRIPIKGDGSGAEATIIINNDSRVESVVVSNGGNGYTFARLDLEAGGFPVEGITRLPEFEIVIPPKNGHGADIYRELGATNILIYSRLENDDQDPDFIVGNQISQIGIVANPLAFNSNEILSKDKASAVGAIKLGVGYQDASFNADSYITQTIGVGKTAIARVISYDKVTGILKYWTDKTNYGFDFTGNQNNPQYGFEAFKFTASPEIGGSINIVGNLSTVPIDTNFGTSINPGISTTINSRTYYVGQPFVQGLSNPEVQKYSGDLIYVDNRPPITRSQNQKEDIKVILQF
jgi:hypothetical protein